MGISGSVILRKLSPAARISLIYLAVGVLWIATSDSALEFLTGNSQQAYTVVQTLKGWLFVITTAALLYLLLRREFNARQRSAQHAAAQEAHFHALFANNPLPMIVYDRETLRFLDVNNAACAYYGYTHDEFLQLSVAQIRPPEDIPRLLESISSFSGMYKDAGVWTHLTKSGRSVEVEVYMLMFKVAERPAILSVIYDVTEQKRAETERLENEKLRLSLQQENELQTMRSRFISMVSHEFRRPVTTITTSIELLEHYRSRMTDESAQKHFSRIHEQLGEMTELLDDFLTLMRTEASETEFKPVPVDLTALCAKMVDDLRQGDEAKHAIHYTKSCASIVVDGDEKLLRHAVGNLLTNAVKYSPEGGDIRLDLQACEQHIEIRVRDQGIGIPPEDQPHIFDPFVRATNVGELSGTGLGLSIARKSVITHGGTLAIASSDSTGTEFIITLPVNERTILTGC